LVWQFTVTADGNAAAAPAAAASAPAAAASAPAAAASAPAAGGAKVGLPFGCSQRQLLTRISSPVQGSREGASSQEPSRK